jgi:hypothetical protein
MSLSQWLRRNSERYLIEAAQDDMARRYLGRMPSHAGDGIVAAFWRRVYVPVYRRIPWAVRRRLIVAMPGSHRRAWRGLGAAPAPPPPDSPHPAPHEQGGR